MTGRLRLTLAIALLSVPATLCFGQRTATCTISNFNRAGGFYSFDVWARRTNVTGAIPVGTSQFFFDYNAAALTNPTIQNINPLYSGAADSSGDYLPMRVDLVGGKIAVTVFFVGNNTGNGQPLSTAIPDGERFCTVRLTIATTSQPAALHWDVVNSALTTTNSLPVTHTFVGDDENPLPVQLANFTGTRITESTIRLTWQTLTEVNSFGFNVQKSRAVDSGFVTIPNSFLPGQGTTQDTHDYAFTDSAATADPWYYRLEHIDLDGTTRHSEPVEVDQLTGVADGDVPLTFALEQNYPNPFNPTTNIEFRIAGQGFVSLKVYNLLGQEVVTLVNEVRPAGVYKERFDASGLASGVYLYRLSTPSQKATRKLSLIR